MWRAGCGARSCSVPQPGNITMTTEQLSLNDHSTLQAIGILADVLDKVSGPTVLDTVLVSKALRQVLATRSQPALDFASRAFMTLDPEIRVRIAENAEEAAVESMRLRGRVSGLVADVTRRGEVITAGSKSTTSSPQGPSTATPASAPSQKPRPAAAPVSSGSGFLTAINNRRWTGKPGDTKD